MKQTLLVIGSDNMTKKQLSEDAVLNTVNKYVDGCTVRHSKGLWKGDTELNTEIEILTEQALDCINTMVTHLKKQFKQDAILVMQNDVKAEFL